MYFILYVLCKQILLRHPLLLLPPVLFQARKIESESDSIFLGPGNEVIVAI